MSNIKRYSIESPWADDFEVVVEIDHDLLTDELLHQINNFWCEAEYRLDECDGNVLYAVLGILYRKVWWSLVGMGGDAHIEHMVEHFEKNLEGWPLMDGSSGIKFIKYDPIEFDHNPEIKEVAL